MKILLLLMISMAYPAPRHRPVEYILTAKAALTEAQVSSALETHKPDSIRFLGNGQYLIVYKTDPGAQKLDKAGNGVFTISPNLKYKRK